MYVPRWSNRMPTGPCGLDKMKSSVGVFAGMDGAVLCVWGGDEVGSDGAGAVASGTGLEELVVAEEV